MSRRLPDRAARSAVGVAAAAVGPTLWSSHLMGTARQPPPGEGESLRTVVIALLANAGIAAAKFVAALLTRSSAMLAEAIHATADTGNQVLLLLADRLARRPPDETHPLGHGREAYFWALVAALGMFVTGALLAVRQGIMELFHPVPVTSRLAAYVVLGISFWPRWRVADAGLPAAQEGGDCGSISSSSSTSTAAPTRWGAPSSPRTRWRWSGTSSPLVGIVAGHLYRVGDLRMPRRRCSSASSGRRRARSDAAEPRLPRRAAGGLQGPPGPAFAS